jgi:hypothetical protein
MGNVANDSFSSSVSQTFGDGNDRAMAFWFLATEGKGNLSLLFP